MKKEEIIIKGHFGKWHVIDRMEYRGKQVYLLEHDCFGDEAACLIVDENLKIIMDDVWNGFQELEFLSY